MFFETVNSCSSAQKKKKFSIKDLLSKYGQIRRKQPIWSHLLEKSVMKNLIFVQLLAYEMKGS